MFFQNLRRPLAKFGCGFGADSIAHGNDGIQIKLLDTASNPAIALLVNYRQILGSSTFLKLPFCLHILQV
jgi:hypothetical protein